ncbi:Olfactory receptor 10AG1 [Lemmus lemmus]
MDGSTLQSPRQKNHSTLVEFILLDFSDAPNFQEFLFGVFLIIYLIIVISNSFIIISTRTDPSLQSPMYFFLGNFSFSEICYVSVILPRLLTSLYRQDRSISFMACATQMYLFLVLGVTECLILTVMAYDRYVAICNPLLYPLIMNNTFCIQLATGCWVTGQTYQIFSLPYCGSNKINHFFCDIPPILKLACGDTFVNNLAIYVAAVAFIMVPFLLIIASYGKIICNILKLSSAGGRSKAFSTCSSHLIVVVLFYGTAIITYVIPKSNQSESSSHSALSDKLLSLFYTIVTPMFNPLIYSLRNKDVIAALRRLLHRA